VLPFANLSNDPDQQYFADGITEDLTTELSHIPDMLVIASSTASTLRNKPVDAKQIGRELGVRYLLEGSVQRSGDQIRVNAQLIDAESNAHLWADRFDRNAGDVLVLQNEITHRIADTLGVELISREAPDRSSVLMRSITFCRRALRFRSHRRETTMNRRSAYSSTRWRSIRNLLRRRAGWQSCSRCACSTE
jgi:TolB-like protein